MVILKLWRSVSFSTHRHIPSILALLLTANERFLCHPHRTSHSRQLIIVIVISYPQPDAFISNEFRDDSPSSCRQPVISRWQRHDDCALEPWIQHDLYTGPLSDGTIDTFNRRHVQVHVPWTAFNVTGACVSTIVEKANRCPMLEINRQPCKSLVNGAYRRVGSGPSFPDRVSIWSLVGRTCDIIHVHAHHRQYQCFGAMTMTQRKGQPTSVRGLALRSVKGS